MKKLLVVFFVFVLVALPLVSCSSDAIENPIDTTLTSTEQTTEAPTTEAATKPLTYTDDPLLAKIVEHMAEDDDYLIFVIGDSVTQGSGASNPVTLDYTAQFTKKLAEHMPDKNVYRIDGKPNGDYSAIQYPNKAKHVPVQRVDGASEIAVARCGIGGNTVKSIIARSSDFIGKELRGRTGDLFIIMSGINDYDSRTYDMSKYASPKQYQNQLNTLIDMIYEGHPDADIIIMTPTYVGNDGKGLDLYAKMIHELSSEREIAVIDLHKLWMDHWVEGAENYGQGDWLNSGEDGDSCHPSDVGHEAIADEMIRCLFGIDPNN